ncbi:MAG: tRNA modification GTPase MnmE [Candidatus Hydrogenedentota bacterium]
MKRPPVEDTIAAISTPPGEGGIGIVRLSGPRAIAIAAALFQSSRGRDPLSGRGRIFYGVVHDASGPVDEVLLHIMRAPHSYTREDVVEINAHGGPGPLNAILELTLLHGARLAEPGEFTKRAFLNGRIDLIQAEAVIDRIQAQTRAALRAAHAAAGGALSKAIQELNQTLGDALARVESAIDFPEEDVPDLVDESLRRQIESARESMLALLATAETGRLYREGARLAIVGRPNVGKSSLFNALLRDARAIVTSQPGTTRDILEEVITIQGIPVRVSDTAGLRSTDDEVEQIGIERARGALHTADAVFLLLDASKPVTDEDTALAAEISDLAIPAVLVLNKSDIVPDAAWPAWSTKFDGAVRLSARNGEGLTELEHVLGSLLVKEGAISPDQGLITRMHQRDSLRRAAAALTQCLANFQSSPEFLSIDLREALDALGEITGETTSDDILTRIFSSFCIGK